MPEEGEQRGCEHQADARDSRTEVVLIEWRGHNGPLHPAVQCHAPRRSHAKTYGDNIPTPPPGKARNHKAWEKPRPAPRQSAGFLSPTRATRHRNLVVSSHTTNRSSSHYPEPCHRSRPLKPTTSTRRDHRYIPGNPILSSQAMRIPWGVTANPILQNG